MQNRKLKNAELNRLSVDQFQNTDKIPAIIILDNVRSANNVGSVFRTSDAYLIEKIFLCGITACPPNKEIQKTALGAQDSVHWEYAQTTEEAIESLQEEGYKIYAIEQAENSIDLRGFSLAPEEKYAFILGNEVKGVSQKAIDLCDGVIELPQYGTKHSLNISVTAGILIWDIATKFAKDTDL